MTDSLTRLYVCGYPYSTPEEDLHRLFSQYGEVAEVSMLTDKDTGLPRGFGFVTMSSPEEADDAIANLNGARFGGRHLKVELSKFSQQPKFVGRRV